MVRIFSRALDVCPSPVSTCLCTRIFFTQPRQASSSEVVSSFTSAGFCVLRARGAVSLTSPNSSVGGKRPGAQSGHIGGGLCQPPHASSRCRARTERGLAIGARRRVAIARRTTHRRWRARGGGGRRGGVGGVGPGWRVFLIAHG